MFAKVFTQILDSSIAEDYHVRLVFEDMLKLCDIEGDVDMTHESISRRTNVPLEIVRRSIAELEKADPRSRNPDNDGRRIVRLDEHRDWGWKILNYRYYRSIASDEQRRQKTKDRVQRHRSKSGPNDECNADVTQRNGVKRDVTLGNAGNAMQRQRQRQMDQDCTYEPQREEILTPTIDPNWPKRMSEIHAWYCEQEGELAYNAATERLWFEWFRQGYEEDDFKLVLKFKRALVDEGDHPNSVTLRNLLSDRFGENLQLAKKGFKPNGKHRPNSLGRGEPPPAVKGSTPNNGF